jgi:hypothetical protein
MKRPSFQFYPSDWLRDTALRSCSVGARGLWIDMICFMHEGNPYGTLKVGNKVILPVNLAAMTGATLPEVEGWLDELESAEVFDRGEEGEIMSRRMIRDENLRNVRAAGGKKGGNPALMVNPKVNPKVNLEDKQNPTPSSSSSSSSSSSTTVTNEKSAQAPSASLPPSLPHQGDFREAWSRWEKHRREIKKPLRPTQTEAQLKKLATMTEARAVAMIDHTIEMGWQGLREGEQVNGSEGNKKSQSTLQELMGGRKLNIIKASDIENNEHEFENEPDF